jgi:hypothetical protein
MEKHFRLLYYHLPEGNEIEQDQVPVSTSYHTAKGLAIQLLSQTHWL